MRSHIRSKKMKPEDFNTKIKPTWCPGCGSFGLWQAVKQALVNLKLKAHQVFSVYGIGCSGNGVNFLKTYAFHSLHGRTLPVATGVRLANHELTIFAFAGDGDCYGIGLNHFIHSCRRNLDIVLIVHNNQIYGLTTGQTSPTADYHTKTKSTPHGVIEQPINPLSLALAADATYVSRGFAGDIPHLTKLIEGAIKHKGFALVDVLQPCVTWNKINTFEWFQKRIYKLEDRKYDPGNKNKAFREAEKWGNKIPIGLFYKEKRLTYGEELPQIKKTPLYKQEIDNIDISDIVEEFK